MAKQTNACPINVSAVSDYYSNAATCLHPELKEGVAAGMMCRHFIVLQAAGGRIFCGGRPYIDQGMLQGSSLHLATGGRPVS